MVYFCRDFTDVLIFICGIILSRGGTCQNFDREACPIFLGLTFG